MPGLNVLGLRARSVPPEPRELAAASFRYPAIARSARHGSRGSSARSATRSTRAHPELLSGERLWIDTGSLEGFAVLALDQHGEIVPPILVEVEIDAFRRFADLRHHAFDQLVAAGETPEALDVVGGRGRGRPKSPKPPRPLRALRPRRRAARSRRHGCRGTNRLGRASSDELALQPDAFCALHHIDLRERVAVAVGAGVSIVKLDLGP